MSKFSSQHYEVVADVIKDWIFLNPGMRTEHVDSLINGFIITFKTDSNRFSRNEFEHAIMKGGS